MVCSYRDQEWRDSLFLRYVIDPPDLQDHCNECGAAFYICHCHNCNNGGILPVCNNKLLDGVTGLASKAFTSTHVRDDLKIYTSHAIYGGKDKLKGSPSKDKGG